MTGSIDQIWPLTNAGKQVITSFRGNLPRMGGKFGGVGGFILVASSEETSMTYLSVPDNADIRPRPSARLDALIAEAIANVAQADADVAAAMEALETIEPHPHAHGHTAGKDCLYAGFRAEDLEPLAGLRGRRWRKMISGYRERGSWRGWAPTKRQGRLMRRIEAARGLPMTALLRRGDASDWIRDAGENPRFNFASGE